MGIIQPTYAAVRLRPVPNVAPAKSAKIECREHDGSKSLPAGMHAAAALQLTTYALLTGCSHARTHTLVRTKSPSHVQHTIAIDSQARRYAETIYPMAAEGMASGLYPANRLSRNCARAYCSHWQICEAEYGGTVRD